jgi:RNA polymerase sigma-70 factor (ECF subfamily)
LACYYFCTASELITNHPHPESLSDEELLSNIRAECTDCFTALFRRYFHQVYAVSYKILRERSEAEDLLQEVFLAIYLQQERFDSSRGSVRIWILQFAYFKALLRRRYLRIRNFYKQEEFQEARDGRVLVHPAEQFGLNQAEWTRFVERGVGKLTDKQRRTIEFVHVEGYTLQEAADAQRETLANTRNCYYRGLKALRSFLLTNPQGQQAQEAQLVVPDGALRLDF